MRLVSGSQYPGSLRGTFGESYSTNEHVLRTKKTDMNIFKHIKNLCNLEHTYIKLTQLHMKPDSKTVSSSLISECVLIHNTWDEPTKAI